jgi:hypothetical protein
MKDSLSVEVVAQAEALRGPERRECATSMGARRSELG